MKFKAGDKIIMLEECSGNECGEVCILHRESKSGGNSTCLWAWGKRGECSCPNNWKLFTEGEEVNIMNKTAKELLINAYQAGVTVRNNLYDSNNSKELNVANQDWALGSVELHLDGTEPFIKEAKSFFTMAGKDRWEYSGGEFGKALLEKLSVGYSLSFCVLDQDSRMMIKASIYEQAQKVFEEAGIHAKMVLMLDGSNKL